ncbi:unnamed protein product [Mytilus edulis]|uniref:Peptidase A2 domain-containing protein n=1 Tax=Mytilus edulis TaxID=6550 RepID=A0A8S3V083_MYTED|nr:unnamed protein product [Mytilus edulis]
MAEARPILSDVGLIPLFDVGNDINSLGQRWTRWLRSFNLYATGEGVVEAQQKNSIIVTQCWNGSTRCVLYPGGTRPGHNVTLQQLRETAQAMEAAEKQATSIEQPIDSVIKVSTYANKKQNQNKSELKQISCYACGFSGHYKTDPKCPAKGKKCRLCQNEGHFEKCCKSKKKISKNHYSRKTNVRHVESADDTCSEPDYENEDDDYAFTVHGNQGKVSKFSVNVGGIDVPVVIDSGATVNIIDRTPWEHLKKNKIKCESKTSSKNLYAYGSNKPLTIAGSFNTNVCVNDRCVSADFFVIEEDGQALLGHKTSIELGVLKIETNAYVNTVTDNVVKTNYTSKFPKVFSGVGKLVDFQLKIPIDKSIQPVIQPVWNKLNKSYMYFALCLLCV